MKSKIFITLALTLLLSTTCSLAQSGKPRPTNPKKTEAPEKTEAQKQTEAYRERALDLIQRSHALNDQLPPNGELALLIHNQIQAVRYLDAKLAREYTHELFDLGTRMGGNDAVQAQTMAVNGILWTEPDEALKLLLQIDFSSLMGTSSIWYPFENSGASVSIKFLFDNLAQKKGKAALPKIFSAANTIAVTGRYPYWAVFSAAVDTKDEAVIETTARMLLTRFQQRDELPAAAFDFEDMLLDRESAWPKALLKPAIHSAIDGLLAFQNVEGSESNKRKTETSDAGVALFANGPREIGLLKMRPLVKKADPGLFGQLGKTYPRIFGESKFDASSSPATQPAVKTYSSREHQLYDIRETSVTDPEKARQMIAAINDPATRAEADALVAQELAERNPEKSAEFAAKAEREGAQSKDLKTLFQIACARLQSDAGRGLHADTIQDLDGTFLLAEKLMRQARDEKTETRYLLDPLMDAIDTAVMLEPELTVAHIESIYMPLERAQLYAEAALKFAEKVKTQPATNSRPAETANNPQANN